MNAIAIYIKCIILANERFENVYIHMLIRQICRHFQPNLVSNMYKADVHNVYRYLWMYWGHDY
jgi:hypothetical protein